MIRVFLSGLKKGFSEFGESIAAITNAVLLSVVYIIGIGVTSLAAKALGKRFLDYSKKKSYWSKLNLEKEPTDEYYRQF